MKKSISHFKLKRFILHLCIFFSLLIIWAVYFDKTSNLELFLLCMCGLSSVPIFAHLLLHFNHCNSSVVSITVNDRSFEIVDRHKINKIDFSDILSVHQFMTPNNFNGRLPFLSWDDYYYLIITTKDNYSFVLSNILYDQISDLFKDSNLVKKKVIYPYIYRSKLST